MAIRNNSQMNTYREPAVKKVQNIVTTNSIFVATDLQTEIVTTGYNPDNVSINVEGLNLFSDEFVATDGINITLLKPVILGEKIEVSSSIITETLE